MLFRRSVGKWTDNLRTGGSWGRCVTGWLDCEFAFGRNLMGGHGQAIRKETATVYADRVVFYKRGLAKCTYWNSAFRFRTNSLVQQEMLTLTVTCMVKESGFRDELILKVQTELHVLVYINGYFIWCPYIPIEDQFVWMEGGWGRSSSFICLQGSYCKLCTPCPGSTSVTLQWWGSY